MEYIKKFNEKIIHKNILISTKLPKHIPEMNFTVEIIIWKLKVPSMEQLMVLSQEPSLYSNSLIAGTISIF